jgi:hypothetical protein
MTASSLEDERHSAVGQRVPKGQFQWEWAFDLRSYDGANRDRTGDLLLAKQALSQLSYGPVGLGV